jgi:putative ATPase
MPEGLFLTQATLSRALRKSNAIPARICSRSQDAAETSREPVPLYLRNAATPLMKHLGYGREYRYVHEDAGAKDEMSCLPENLRAKIYYEDDGTAEDTEKT